ncbi:MAG: hypothetical protein ACRD0C_10345 [Acidimicrobiia bacterium]
MGKLVDLRDATAGTVNAHPDTLTDELAACLERFLDGTADEGTLSRGRRAVEAWHVRHDPLPVRVLEALPLTP